MMIRDRLDEQKHVFFWKNAKLRHAINDYNSDKKNSMFAALYMRLCAIVGSIHIIEKKKLETNKCRFINKISSHKRNIAKVQELSMVYLLC